MTALNASGVLTIIEASEFLKVTPQTIHNLINRGQLRRYKVGRSTRIPAVDVYSLVGLNEPGPAEVQD